jgi:hypothetical protein
MRELAAQSLAIISAFDPERVVKDILIPLTGLCFHQALHIRHGAVLGVGEIIIGLSGNSIGNRQQALDKAMRTLSLKERSIVKEETENKKAFTLKYQEISTKDNLATALDVETRATVVGLVN